MSHCGNGQSHLPSVRPSIRLRRRLRGAVVEVSRSAISTTAPTIRPGRSYPLRIAMAVAIAMLIAGCGSSSEAGPKEPNSKVDAATTAPSPAPSSAVQGSFSQVGGWIAYGGEDGIWAVDPARPKRRIWLSGAGRDPIAWSRDGTKLLIRRTLPRRLAGLWVLKADATEKRLTDGWNQTGGSFSPDGAEIVYADGIRGLPAIYAQRLDGGAAPRLILRSSRRVSFPDGHSALAYVYEPALSPDGTRIAYFDGMYDHSHNLWVTNADGRKRRLVLGKEVSAAAGHVRSLTWAPNGEWLAFVTDSSVYLVRPDGTGLRRVASSGVNTPGVQWSPEGSRIAYLRIGESCTSVTGKDEDFICEGTLSIANVNGIGEQVIEGIRTPMNSSIAWNPSG
jgi:dipeptidyl aminopeptidase/acylaminoacyl peptidase